MRLAALLLVALLVGCSAPAPTTPSATTPEATTPASTTPVASTPTSSTPVSSTPAGTPVSSTPTLPADLPKPPEGAAFEVKQWEEPTPPRADLIHAQATSGWTLRVTGQPGAAPANARLLVEELGATRGVLGRAAPDGSFALDVTGGEGAWLHVALVPEQLPPGATLLEKTTKWEHVLPSTYVRASAAPWSGLAPGERPAWATGHVPFANPWRFAGGVEVNGDAVHVRGSLRIDSTTGLDPFGVHVRATRIFDETGEPMPDLGQFATSTLTPSGLALERLTKGDDPTLSAPFLCNAPARESADTLRCDVDLTTSLAGLPAGGYAVRLWVPIAAPPGAGEGGAPDLGAPNGRQYDAIASGTPLTLVDHGHAGPFRLAALLLADASAQGERGAQAEGDKWGWASGILTQPAVHVTPRLDATGKAIAYALDPYVPQVLLADRETPNAPYVNLALPGGNWSVDVTDPQGATTTLGPMPFAELASRTLTTGTGSFGDNGGYNVDGVGRLAAGMTHAFARDGWHDLRVHGDVRDVDGNAFRLEGTYRVLVAQPLQLDLGMLPGTPLAAGDNLDRAVTVHPPVPAQVDYRFREWTGPGAALTVDEDTPGNASAFGWAHPHPGHPIRPTVAGEYRVDVLATYAAPDGALWAGSVTFGGVVVDPASALDVHGRRGIDVGSQTLDRFTRAQAGALGGDSHVNMPYRSGDVAWQADDDAMDVAVTLGDPDGTVAPLFTSRATHASRLFADSAPQPGGALLESHDAGDVAARWQHGQGPLFSSTASGRDPSLGEPLDRFGYFYAAVEKPGVRVREDVREDFYLRPYWRFDDPYALQPGMGPDGDRPNDYKFLFAGAVVRDPSQGVARTGAYASLWIDRPAGDLAASRVGSAFDPQAPPLFSFPSGPVRAFYDPTGTRPGSLLVQGDVADFGGYVMPLGPQKLWINVTSPAGKVRSFATQANAWGFVHDPALNFVVGEPGVWHADVHVLACPPAADAAWPCQGGAMDDGTTGYAFYVASPGVAPLRVRAPAWLPAGGDMQLPAPEALAGGHATAWMPGWTLDARSVGPDAPVVGYHPQQIAARVPNFDPQGWKPGAPADRVAFTAVAKDADGAWRGLALDAWGARVLAP